MNTTPGSMPPRRAGTIDVATPRPNLDEVPFADAKARRVRLGQLDERRRRGAR